MKTKLIVIGIVVAGFVGGPLRQDSLAVTDEEFRALQQQMQQQGEQIQDLKKGREADQQEIQKLKDKLGETEKTTAETQKATEDTQKKLEETQKTVTEVKAQSANPVASEEATAKSNFLVSGAFNVLYSKTEGSHGSFVFGEFNPLFMYRFSDKVLFEGEMVFSLDTADTSGETEATTEIEYATLDYVLNDYVTIVAGKMILPLATFKERLDASWINKMPTFPLPYRDELDPIAPESDVGIQARGGFYVGDNASVGYSAYLVNGPNSDVDPGTGDETINLGRTGLDFNGSPSGGARLGLFIPCPSHPNNDFEIGVSGQTGTWDTNDKLLYSVFAVDAALHLGPYLEVRGEFLHSWQEQLGLPVLERSALWAQIAYSLSGVELDFPMIRNTELVFRYGGDENPGGYVNQYAFGIDYHITHTLQLKADYEVNKSGNPDFDNDQFNVQMAWGF